jgi:flavin reductase (DIM6/NTAB) family NADH-FMN oxidoreductase RutF
MSQLVPVPVVDRLPAVPGALAHVAFTLDRHIDAGDHVIVFGAVQRAWHRDGEPLAFLSGRFGDYTDRGHEPGRPVPLNPRSAGGPLISGHGAS